MDNIDYEGLRQDLMNFYEGGFFVAGYGAAALTAEDIKIASNEQLIIEAEKLGVDLNNYIRIERS